MKDSQQHIVILMMYESNLRKQHTAYVLWRTYKPALALTNAVYDITFVAEFDL